MKVIHWIWISFDLIQIERMRCKMGNNINREAPITCGIRINRPIFIFSSMYIIGSKAIVKKSL